MRHAASVFRLFSDRLLAVVDADNPLGQAETLEPQNLRNQTFIVPAEGSRQTPTRRSG